MESVYDDDLLTSDAIDDPYSLFAEMRRSRPVHWNVRYRAWMVTRHADVLRGLRDPSLSSDRIGQLVRGAVPGSAGHAAMEILSRWLVFKDPPDHTRLRRLVNKGFTTNAVSNIQSRIDTIVDQLLDQCEARTAFDVVEDIAFPLPTMVIAELLGAPAADRDLFRTWSDRISPVIFGTFDAADRRLLAEQAVLELADYFTDLVRTYEHTPADNVVSSLIHARDSREALSQAEVIATCMLLLFAGHETTTNLIGNGIYHLLMNPEQRALLDRDPGLAAPAVEEALRYDGPAKMTVRVANAPTSIDGNAVRAGDRVFLVQAAANRDPDVFPDPDVFDIRRKAGAHLGFGFGIHFCLGAPLARSEAQAVFAKLFLRFPSLALTGEAVSWEPVLLSRGVLTLPVFANRSSKEIA